VGFRGEKKETPSGNVFGKKKEKSNSEGGRNEREGLYPELKVPCRVPRGGGGETPMNAGGKKKRNLHESRSFRGTLRYWKEEKKEGTYIEKAKEKKGERSALKGRGKGVPSLKKEGKNPDDDKVPGVDPLTLEREKRDLWLGDGEICVGGGEEEGEVGGNPIDDAYPWLGGCHKILTLRRPMGTITPISKGKGDYEKIFGSREVRNREVP